MPKVEFPPTAADFALDKGWTAVDPELPSRARQRRVERRPCAAGFEVIRAKESASPGNTAANANNRRLNEALEPVSGAAARALRSRPIMFTAARHSTRR